MQTEPTTVQQLALTQTEAQSSAPDALVDKETVAMVQRMLLAKGYVDGGPANGVFGQKTKDEILTFRARNNLQLVPTIDADLIKALETAPAKALPLEQVLATKETIAPKVEVVHVVDKVRRSAWWTKLWAYVTGIPPMLITLAGFVINSLDDATSFITPLKNLLYGVEGISPLVWIGLISFVALIMGYQAMTIAKLSKQIENAAVEGYQRGTIKNDLPPSDPA